MTNNIKFQSMNFPARVECWDNGTLSDSRIVLVEDAAGFVTYATTSREVRIIDLPSDHPDVLAEMERRVPKPAADEPAVKPEGEEAEAAQADEPDA